MDSETCFPRGKPKPMEEKEKKHREKMRKEIQAENADNYLFARKAVHTDKAPVKKSKKKDDDRPEVLAKSNINEEDLISKKLKNVHYLSYKKVQPESLILGVVTDVDGFEVKISLPFSMNGRLEAFDIHPSYKKALTDKYNGNSEEEVKPLEELFEPGQLLVCKVKEVVKSTVKLTVDPNQVNSNLNCSLMKSNMQINGIVKSEEENGYLIDVGVRGVRAFLPHKSRDTEEELSKFDLVRCVITKVQSNGNIIHLSNDPKRMNKFQDPSNINKNQLLPGTLVKCTVDKKLENQGEILKFGEFYGSISLPALSSGKKLDEVEDEEENENPEEEGKSKKKKRRNTDRNMFGDKLKICCVVYVNYDDEVFCFTDKSSVWVDTKREAHLIKLAEEFPENELSEVKITHCIKGIGIMGEVRGEKAVVLKWNLFDRQKSKDEENLMWEKFKVGYTPKSKIMSNMTLEGVLSLATKQSMLDSNIRSLEDLNDGDLVDGVIKNFNINNGLQVQIGTYSKDGNWIPSFSTRGFVPNIHLNDITLKNPAKFFNEGDKIRCRVLEVDAANKKLRLTNKKTLVGLKNKEVISSFDQLKAGMIVQTFIVKRLHNGLIVRCFGEVKGFVPKYELESGTLLDYEVGQVKRCRVVSVKLETEKVTMSFKLNPSKKVETAKLPTNMVYTCKVMSKDSEKFLVEVSHESSRYRGVLTMNNLTDYTSLSPFKFESIKVGDSVENCVVISSDPLKLSAKQSLYEFHKKHSNLQVEDLQEGQLLPAVVSHTCEFGVFVRLTTGILALCPKKMLTDRFIKSTANIYKDGQSVIAMIHENNVEDKKVIVSLKPSDCGKNYDPHSQVEKYMKHQKLNTDCTGLEVGQFIKNIEKCELLKKYSCNLIADSTEKEDEIKEAVVVDISNNKIILTNNNKVLQAYKKNAKLPKLPKQGVPVECVVLHSNLDVTSCVVGETPASHKALKNLIVKFIPNCNQDATASKNEKVALVLCKTLGKYILAKPVKTAPKKHVSKERMNPKDVEIGTEVTAVVRSVRSTHLILHVTSLPLNLKGKPILGRLHFSEMLLDCKDGDYPLRKFQPNSEMKLKVAGYFKMKSHLHLDVTKEEFVTNLELSQHSDVIKRKMPEVGQLVNCMVKEPLKKGNDSKSSSLLFRVEISHELSSVITPAMQLCHQLCNDNLKKCPVKSGMYVTCHVTEKQGDKIHLLRKGVIQGSDDNVIKQGSVVPCRVVEVVDDGLLVATLLGKKGKVDICDIDDDFHDNPILKYGKDSKHKYIRCKVMDASNEKRLILSMRKSDMEEKSEKSKVNDFEVGQKMKAYVKKFTKFGLFLSVSREVSGRVNLTNLTKYYVTKENMDKVGEVFTPGKLVTCAVESVNGKKVEFSLLSKHTGVDDCIPESLDLPLKHSRSSKKKRKLSESSTAAKVASKKCKTSDEVDSEDVKETVSKPQITIQENGDEDTCGNDDVITMYGNDNDVTMKEESEDSSDDEEGYDDIVPAKKMKKSTLKLSKEQQIENEREAMRIENEVIKQHYDVKNNSTMDVETCKRQVAENPQDSRLWLQLIACHLPSEINQARNIIENEALKNTEIIRSPSDYLNIWMFYINMELKFGNESSVQAVKERAMKCNDQKKVLDNLVEIYSSQQNCEKLDECYNVLMKKHGDNDTVWMKYCKNLIGRGMMKKAEEIHKRALARDFDSKTKRKLMVDYAVESINSGGDFVSNGVVEFEKLLQQFKKDTFIWNKYVECLQKNRMIEECRKAFKRLVEVNFSGNKNEKNLKKYLAFEKKHGTSAMVTQLENVMNEKYNN